MLTFSLTKRLLRPAFSDYAHFSFLTFLCLFQCEVRYPSNALPPRYITYTSSRIFWSLHTSYRVPSLPKATAIAPIAPVRSLHGDTTALPYHRGRRLKGC
jgi:hypothetical protein